ncbi:unnamed protein product [Rotaria socialis]|uniref:G-protein coupled receptors family 1 profile domain-containing protein n=1 Tax=Rotaria socialis TaxID=392032 RepID=A0A819X1Q2_9BILA|nr:unnamed protein product [Rotaria socialis]CAF3675735.1 unnamed protein product [Rotaria socialis]CAF4135275.1 unnamed protein product [Rotaria socialis]CAF4265169.1 unnamed protein product [Rotaria socialis]
MNDNIYVQLSRYTQPVLIIFGTIGALLNQILFHRRKLIKKASCTVYLRALSINDILVLYLIVLTQWLNDQFHWDPSGTYVWFCKIRTYAMFILYAMSPYYIVLVCIDRLCRTSKYSSLRKIATPSKAHRIIIITVLMVILAYSHILFQYNINRSKCFARNFSYYHVLGYFILIFYCLLPPLLMSIFSSWTLILLHCYRRKQEKQYHLKIILPSKNHRCNRNYQLLKILFLYVTTTIICTLPFSILMLLHTHQFNSNRQLVVYIKTAVLLCNVNHCTSFYIYTLGTPLYRRELLHLMQSFRRRFVLWLTHVN